MSKKRCPTDTPTRPDRTSWGIKGKDLYLLQVLRKRMEYPELKRAVREQCQAFGASVVLIKDKASGTTLDGTHLEEPPIREGAPEATKAVVVTGGDDSSQPANR